MPQTDLERADTGDLESLRKNVDRLRGVGRAQEAIPTAARILAIEEGAHGTDSVEVASASVLLAALYAANGQGGLAEPLYRRAIRIREARLGAGHPDVAAVVADLGRLYAAYDQLALAEPLLRQALAIEEATKGAHHDAALAILNDLAELELERGDRAAAEALYLRVAGPGAPAADGDRAQLCRSVAGLALVHTSRGEYAKVEPLVQRVVELSQGATGRAALAAATSLGQLAVLQYDRGDYAKAQGLLQQALAIEEKELGADHPAVATSLGNLALVEQKLGALGEAEGHCLRAREIVEKSYGREHPEVATVLNNLGSLQEARGRYAAAEHLYRQAAAIREKSLGPEHVEVASVLNNLALLHQSLGDYSSAGELHRRALAIRERGLGGEAPQVAESLNNLALVHEASGEHAEAHRLYRRSVEIYRKAYGEQHPDTQAVTGNIAELLLREGRLAEAFPLLRSGDWPAGLGRYYLLKREYRNAHTQFMRAVRGADRYGESRHLLASYVGLGLALEGLGQPVLASRSYEEAVGLIEEQRSALAAADRAHFLRGQVGAGFRRLAPYEGLVRTSARIGDPGAALRWSEHTKARRLLESTARGRSVAGVPAAVLEREQALLDHLEALRMQREDTIVKNPELSRRLEAESIREAREQLDAFVAELRRSHPAYAAYRYPRPLGAEEFGLRPGEVLLEFAVTDDATFAWVVRDGAVARFVTIALGREKLDREVRGYRALFEGVQSSSDLRPATEPGRRLYDLLLRDALSACRPGETLVIVPDGSLGLVPFEALVANASGGEVRYVGDLFPVQYAQSATVLSNARALGSGHTAPRSQATLVLADPVFDADDGRWPGGPGPAPPARDLRWWRLEETAKLPRALAAQKGSGQVQTLSGADATERSLRSQSLSRYGYLVFATHGVLGGQIERLGEPALVLGQVGADSRVPENDGYLTLTEVMGLSLEAEVAALTACETGVGEDLDGEGVMGMGWAFQYAGARNVTMSLWSVDQVSAVRLTEKFFEQLREGADPQGALREARASLRREGYHHPFFWAPFILMGQG